VNQTGISGVYRNMPDGRTSHWRNSLLLFRNTPVRTGISVGVCLSLSLMIWLVLANYVPFLERFALERYLAGAGLIGFLGLVPILRFIRSPRGLLVSSLLGWFLFAAFYWFLCIFFHRLPERLSPFHLFMYGAVIYLIVTTISWIGSVVWKVRASHISHSNHHPG
jgi:hypothetical protein